MSIPKEQIRQIITENNFHSLNNLYILKMVQRIRFTKILLPYYLPIPALPQDMFPICISIY